jgi:hypothetical protein
LLGLGYKPKHFLGRHQSNYAFRRKDQLC